MSHEVYRHQGQQYADRPSWTKRINTITDFFMQNCNAPYYVYVKTFFPAAGEAILSLLTFGMDDVFRGFARPKSVSRRNRYRSDKRRAVRVNGKLVRLEIPEIGEEIGKRIPGSDRIRSLGTEKWAENIWILDGYVQRVFWYMQVIDITSQFGYRWASEIIKSEGDGAVCKGRSLARFNTGISGLRPQFINIPVGSVVYEEAGATYVGTPSSSNNWAMVPGVWRCICQGEMVRTTGPDTCILIPRLQGPFSPTIAMEMPAIVSNKNEPFNFLISGKINTKTFSPMGGCLFYFWNMSDVTCSYSWLNMNTMVFQVN